MRRSAGSDRPRRTRSRASTSIFRTSCNPAPGLQRHSKAILPRGRNKGHQHMNAPHEQLVAQDAIVFTLNGEEVSAAPGETIIQAADRIGVSIPRLCYKPGYRPDGNCRACMVEIKGERVLAPSCCRQPTAGMEVASTSARAVHSQKIIVELLASDMPERVVQDGLRARLLATRARRSASPASRAARSPRPTCRIRRWRSISTPASSARAVCARAARSRSTT